MKFKTISLQLAIVCLLLISCDDSPSIEPAIIGDAQDSIFGTWKLTGIDVKIEDKVIKVSDEGLENTYYTDSKYTFTEDGKYVFTFSDGEAFEGTYEFNKETKELKIIEDEEFSYNYSLKIEKDKITLVSPEVSIANTDIFGDDPNGYFLFEAFSLLDDQADDLADLLEEDDDLLSISYYYEKE